MTCVSIFPSNKDQADRVVIQKSNLKSQKVVLYGGTTFLMRIRTKLKISVTPLKEHGHLSSVESPHDPINGCILSSTNLNIMMDLMQLQSLFRVEEK